MGRASNLDPQQRQHRYVENIFTILNKIIAPLPVLDPYDIGTWGRTIGTLIYELKGNYSGFASVDALIQKYNFNHRWSREHMWPRQMAGEALIVDFWKKSRTNKFTPDQMMTQLREDLEQLTVVNYTTKEENDRLRSFQEAHTWISPEHAYRQAGIKLVLWPSNTRITKLPYLYPYLKPLLKSTKKYLSIELESAHLFT